MSTLQIRIDTELAKAIKTQASHYKIPSSSLVKIVLVKEFLHKKQKAMKQGNVFNAERDNNGKGIPMKDFINLL